eukprot:1265287-Rhodomonas_salina.2
MREPEQETEAALEASRTEMEAIQTRLASAESASSIADQRVLEKVRRDTTFQTDRRAETLARVHILAGTHPLADHTCTQAHRHVHAIPKNRK